MKQYFFLAVMLSASLSAHANPTEWMTSDTPNELGLHIYEGNNACHFGKSRVKDIVDNKFIRAGIKPTDKYNLYLDVTYMCLSVSNTKGIDTGNVIYVDIRFGSYHNGELINYASPTYGHIASAGTDYKSVDYFIDSIGKQTDSALTDFLMANHR